MVTHMIFTKLMDALFSSYTNLGTRVPKTTQLLRLSKINIFLELSFFFQQGNQTLAALKLVTDIWFICDMMLNFRTGVFRYHIRKVLEMDPTEIRRLYIKGWFFIDLIATFPFDVFFDLILLGSTEVRSAQESLEGR